MEDLVSLKLSSCNYHEVFPQNEHIPLQTLLVSVYSELEEHCLSESFQIVAQLPFTSSHLGHQAIINNSLQSSLIIDYLS